MNKRDFTAEEKRELADSLLPALAWDLAHMEVFQIRQVSNIETGARAEMFLQDFLSRIRTKIYEGEEFDIVIMPKQKRKIGL